MAGDSVGSSIMFIAVVIVTATVASTLGGLVLEMGSSMEFVGEQTSERMDADLHIISDPSTSAAIYDSNQNELTVLVKNTGRTTLGANPDEIDLLVNGQYVDSVDNIDIIGKDDSLGWRPTEVIEITATVDLNQGEHRITVSAYQNEDSLIFYNDN